LKLLGKFAFHTIVGVVLFSLVGAAAVSLNYLTNLIELEGVSAGVIIAMRVLELFLFAVDFLCLVVFVCKEAWDFCREIMR
jgi:hypothetical protein